MGVFLSVDVIWPRGLAELGTFIGGAVSPLALIWLVGTYLSQREELAETRKELSRQAAAQEGALQASLSQQVLAGLPIAGAAILERLWPFLDGADQIGGPQQRDIGFVAKRVRLLTQSSQLYGDQESRAEEMRKRGVIDALDFALSQIGGLTRLADVADNTGALRALVQSTLRATQIEGLRTKAKDLGGV